MSFLTALSPTPKILIKVSFAEGRRLMDASDLSHVFPRISAQVLPSCTPLESGFSLVFFLRDLLNSKQAMVQPPCKKKTQKILLKLAAKAPGKTGEGWKIIRIWEPAYLGNTRDSPRYTKQPAPKWSANYSPIPRFLVPEVCFLNLKYLLLLPFVDWIGWASHLEEYNKSSKWWKGNKHIETTTQL